MAHWLISWSVFAGDGPFDRAQGRSAPHFSLVKFYRNQPGLLLARVGHGVGDASFNPLNVSGFELKVGSGFALSFGFEIKIGDSDDQVRTRVGVLRDDASGLKVDVGDTGPVLDEEDVDGASVKNGKAAVGIPLRVAVLEELDGDVAEGCVGEVFRGVGEGGGRVVGFAVFQFERDRGLIFHVVLDLAVTERNKHVIVTVPVNERRGVRRDFDLEDPDVGVLESEVVSGLRGDFDFLGLCEQQGRGENE